MDEKELDAKALEAKELRAKGLSYAKIEKIIGVTRASIAKWERNGWQRKKNGAPFGHSHNKGKTGPPRGAKNAQKTGLYTDINYYTMSDIEREIYDGLKADPMQTLIDNLKSLAIRKLRMQAMREQIEEQIEAVETRQIMETGGNLLQPRKVMEKVITKQALLDKKLALEEAITKVEDLERRTAEALHRMKKEYDAEHKREQSFTFNFVRSNNNESSELDSTVL